MHLIAMRSQLVSCFPHVFHRIGERILQVLDVVAAVIWLCHFATLPQQYVARVDVSLRAQCIILCPKRVFIQDAGHALRRIEPYILRVIYHPVKKEMICLNQGYGQSAFRVGASNPEMIRRQIGQDLGYYGQQGQQSQPSSGQMSGSQGYMGQNAGGRSMLSEFGSQGQYVQQQIREDLGQSQSYSNQGYGSSPVNMRVTNTQAVRQQIHGTAGQPLGGQSQYMNNQFSSGGQGAYGGSGYEGYNSGVLRNVMSASPSDARQVQSHIAQDMGGYGGGYGAQPGQFATSAFGQFGTNPQAVQRQIQQDIGYQGAQGAQGAYSQAAFMGSNAQNSGTFAQFASNPQMVQQHIQEDLNPGSRGTMSTYGGNAAAYMGGMMNVSGTNPGQIRQQLHQGGNQGPSQGQAGQGYYQ